MTFRTLLLASMIDVIGIMTSSLIKANKDTKVENRCTRVTKSGDPVSINVNQSKLTLGLLAFSNKGIPSYNDLVVWDIGVNGEMEVQVQLTDGTNCTMSALCSSCLVTNILQTKGLDLDLFEQALIMAIPIKEEDTGS